MASESSVGAAPALALCPPPPSLPRAEAPSTWTGLEKPLQRPLGDIRRDRSEPGDWSDDGLTAVGSPTASLLMLARPPRPELAPAAHDPAPHERHDEIPPKHSTLRPPAPPPDAAVTEVRLPPHRTPSARSFDSHPPEASEPPTVLRCEPEQRTTRPGFAFDRGDDWVETGESVDESGLHSRPWNAAIEERGRASRELPADDDVRMPGWMRRRRAEERRLGGIHGVAPRFSPRDAVQDESAVESRADRETSRARERRPSRAELEAAAARRRLTLRVGMLGGAFIVGLGVVLSLVL